VDPIRTDQQEKTIIGMVIPCWICQQTNRQRYTGDNGYQHNPERRLTPVGQISDAAFSIALAKGQRGTGNDAPSGGQRQKRSGIVRPDIAANLADHGLITAHFHVLAGQSECHPDQRIEPVDRKCQKCQCLYDMVKVLDVILFVEDDILLFLFFQIAGKIDFRAE